MASVWIVHREPALQGALARLAGAGADALAGSPLDAGFRGASAPELVILGLSGDFEAELEFAHEHSAAHPECAWILLVGARDREEARRLFDTLSVEVMSYPPDGAALRRSVRGLRARRRAATLSERRVRDAVSSRFARWFADLELPAVLRALDPGLVQVPLLIRGEPGTGRGLLAAYVHAFGGTQGGHLARIPCAGLEPETLHAEIAAAARNEAARRGLSLCLEEVERLPLATQRQLRGWVEAGLPAGVAGPAGRVRWMATCSELGPEDPAESLDLALAQVMAGLEVRIPSLRERPDAVETFVLDTALAWWTAHGMEPGRFSADALKSLTRYPWPGNLLELESLVTRTLASCPRPLVEAEDLAFEGEWPQPVVAREADPGESAMPAPLAPPSDADSERDEPGAVEPLRVEPEPVEADSKEPELPPGSPLAQADDMLRRLVGALSHEVRNPLVAIRTFSSLLPQHFDDPDFRSRFAGIVGDDVRRIEATVDQLTRFAGLGPPVREDVDVSALLDELLEARRDEILERRLVVLRELDRERGRVPGDAAGLRFALELLVSRALEQVPERGDIYVASRRHDEGPDGTPTLRILLRFQSPDATIPAEAIEGLSLSETALELVLADAVVRAHGGVMTAGVGEGRETAVLIDLPGLA